MLEGKCGKVPCYNTVENWIKKLGLSTYENDGKPTDKKFAYIIDESIMINREKLLLILGIKMLDCFDNLPKEMQDVYSFVLDYKELLVELKVAVAAVEHIETICKTEGFDFANSKKCKKYITQYVIGNANNCRAMLGIKILEYLK